MHTIIRKFLLVFAASLLAILPVGAQTPQKSTLDVVHERGVLRAGVTKTVPNFGFIDERGNHVGFEYDLVVEIAKRLNVKLEVEPVTSSSRIPMLQQGRIDLVASTMTHYRERDKTIDFSVGYFYSPLTMLVKKNSGIKGVADMAGKRAGADAGSGSIKYFKQIQPKATMQTFEGFEECFLALQQGLIDAITTDATILAGLKANAPNPDEFEILFNKEAVYAGGEYGIGVRENDSKWRDQINFILMDMWNDGTWDKIFNKWVGPGTKLNLTKEELGFKMITWE
jgi:polar amino acid transport system substrate-binding protein